MEFFNYFPLTGFLLMLIFVVGRIYLLKQKQIQVISSSQKNRSSKVLYPVFAFIFLIWIFELIRPAFQVSFSLLPTSVTTLLFNFSILKKIGIILIFGALILWMITLVHFKTSLRMGLDENNCGKLITSGVFSFSRNPFFFSLDLYFLGVASMLSSVFNIVFSLAAIIGIHFFILKEERFLLENYGEEYLNYQQKTGRYF
ncbi:isoprenylcysteine carboxylmethyltransferase family protein [Maribellus sp. YY47]|uniref:methyltransferase family protein n=1 Tax=Maribellus sp. YY47 TaxID=2929486 RepID=UPI0020007C12|nr:isoprenylcysteine carboxylmethyltransferase family protein [Maribellus sp. YY47]MCK3686098.1 isoprenylcysteine carboxylmethyltransferase family protein [Maribellus sp. YY47]